MRTSKLRPENLVKVASRKNQTSTKHKIVKRRVSDEELFARTLDVGRTLSDSCFVETMVSSDVLVVRGTQMNNISFDSPTGSATRRKSFGVALQSFLSAAKKNQRKSSTMLDSPGGDSVIMGAGFGDTTKDIMRKPSGGNTDNKTKRKKSKRFSKVTRIFRRSKKSSSKNSKEEQRELQLAATGDTEATDMSDFAPVNQDISVMTDNGIRGGSISILHATYSEDDGEDSPLSVSLPLLGEPFNEAFETSLISMDAPEYGFNESTSSVEIRELSSVVIVTKERDDVEGEEEASSSGSETNNEADDDAPLLTLLPEFSIDEETFEEEALLSNSNFLEELVKEVEEVVEKAIKDVETTEEDTETEASSISDEKAEIPQEVEELVKEVEDVVEDAIASIEREENPHSKEASFVQEVDDSAEEEVSSVQNIVGEQMEEEITDVDTSIIFEELEVETPSSYKLTTLIVDSLSKESESVSEEVNMSLEVEASVSSQSQLLGDDSPLGSPEADEVNMSLEVEAPISCRSRLLDVDFFPESSEADDVVTPSASTTPTIETAEASPSDSIYCHPPTSPQPETPRLEDVLKGDYEIEFTAAIILDEVPPQQEVAVVPKRRKSRAIIIRKLKQKGGKGLIVFVATVVCIAVCFGGASWKPASTNTEDAKPSRSSGASIFPPKQADPTPLLTEKASVADDDVPSTPPKVRQLLASNYGRIEFPDSVKEATQTQLEKMRTPEVDRDNVLFWFA